MVGTTEFNLNYLHWQQLIESDLQKLKKITPLAVSSWEGVVTKPLYTSLDQSIPSVDMEGAQSLVGLKILAKQLASSSETFFNNEIMAGTDCVTIELNSSADISVLSHLPLNPKIVLRFSSESLFKEFLALKMTGYSIEFDLSSFFLKNKESELEDFLMELVLYSQNYEIAAFIDVQFLQNLGANPVQELIFSSSLAQQILLKTNKKLKVNISLPLSSDIFIELARLKALQQVLSASGHTNVDIQVCPSMCSFTKRSASMNILRGTMTALVGLLGNARKIFITPFDILCNGSDPGVNLDSYRLARNTVLILKEECHLGRVQDPSRGSWYVENLLNQYVTAIHSHVMTSLHDIYLYLETMSFKFKSQQLERLKLYKERQKLIVGVNEFVHFDDSVRSVSSIDNAMNDIASFRWVQAFEDLQDQVDVHIARGKSRPNIFVINVGSIVDYLPRIHFIQNFFEVGGFRLTLNEEGFESVESGLKAFAQSDLSLAIICATDEVYKSMTPNLKVANKAVLLAGHPREKQELWKEAGIYDFVYKGCDAVEKLSQYLKWLGVIA